MTALLYAVPVGAAALTASMPAWAVSPVPGTSTPNYSGPCSGLNIIPGSYSAPNYWIYSLVNNGQNGAGANPAGPGNAGTNGSTAIQAGVGTPTGTAYNFIGAFSTGGDGGLGSNADGLGGDFSVRPGGAGGAGGPGASAQITLNSGTVNLNSGVTSPPASPPNFAVCGYSAGGMGGGQGLPTVNSGQAATPSGSGGIGAAVTVQVNPGAVITSIYGGVAAESDGGNGGNGVAGSSDSGVSGDGTIGGSGVSAGNVTVTLGTISGGKVSINAGQNSFLATYGVYAASLGGAGGAGGNGYDAFLVDYQNGNGGGGGTAGTVTVSLYPGVSITMQRPSGGSAPGILALSAGGAGGASGSGGENGTAGAGGSGGSVIVTLNGAVTTAGDDSPALIAESVGGIGAPGGSSSFGIASYGGTGANGGNGGSVTVAGQSGSFTTAGTNSDAIQALSIGGGGGSGGDAAISASSVGGSGGLAASGATVTVTNAATLSTSGDRSAGILAQSIGGGGGVGGNATGASPLTIGGTAGGGGNGAEVDMANSGAVTTSGKHSPGLMLQSIGGGGGKGGAAYDYAAGSGITVAIALGGSGGAGGTGGTIGLPMGQILTNSATIQTFGSDSDGILAQSIGGGGGAGGTSAATALSFGYAEVPNLTLSEAHGGPGGGGGDAGTVTIINGGAIGTSGPGSRGILAQSIGAGGGRGGDASATSYAAGADVNLTVNLSMGGSGGGAGSGGAVSVTNNNGLVVTTGGDADGVLAQSIGGSGGAGGGSDGSGKSNPIAGAADSDSVSLTTNLTLGGSGGYGGSGGSVNVGNAGGVLTLGDGASGITAHSVGGGGGRAGGAAGNAGSATFSATVNVGGSGGSGGSGGAVTVGNSGAILTFGNDATGIVAQSIGGGGGVGGKAGSSLTSSKSTGDGGNGPGAGSTLGSLITGGAASNGSEGGLTSLANNLLGNSDTSGNPLSRLGSLSSSAGSESDDDESSDVSITAKVSIGGAGGGAGSGGAVTVSNGGSIATTGKLSDGVLAQSIGGGGGKGGAANSTSVSVSDSKITGTLGVGGANGSNGSGGAVTVSNGPGSRITTVGSIGIGVLAQSIGGGGGTGGLSGATTGLLSKTTVSIGGSRGATGDGGVVTVTNAGQITTMSHNSPAIVAQSISGGGGLVRVLANDLDTAGGAVPDNGANNFAFGLSINGNSGNSSSTGSTVTITNTGSIATAGRNAHGIVAQSIGGGGGLVLGGQLNTSQFFQGGPSGNGGQVTIPSSGRIATGGAGAIGILAQSIGGGGVFAGDTAAAPAGSYTTISGTGPRGPNTGSGGSVSITVNSGESVQTAGANAPAIVAQSIGGGGGFLVASTNGVASGYTGTLSGGGGDSTGYGGTVGVTVNGTVSASGAGSAGIFAQSAGQGYGKQDNSKHTITGGNPITINVDSGGTVTGGTTVNGDNNSAPAIWVDGGGSQSTNTANLITINAGATVTNTSAANGSNPDATAIYGTNGYTTVTTGGTVIGAIDVGNNTGGGSNGDVLVGSTGTLRTTRVRLGGGTLTNAGTLDIGGRGMVGSTRVEGNFVQTSTGRLLVDADFRNAAADQLQVTGNASLAGTVVVNALSLRSQPVTVAVAGGTLTYDPGLTVSSSLLLGYAVRSQGSTIQLQPQARFAAAATGFNGTEQSLGQSLQRSFDMGDSAFDTQWLSLAGINDGPTYRAALDSLSGQSLGGIVVGRYEASRNVSRNLDGCSAFVGSSAVPILADCVQFRSEGSGTDRVTAGDTLGFGTAAVTLRLSAQKEFLPDWFVAGSIGYEFGRVNGEGALSGTDKAVVAGVAVKRQQGPLLLSAAADFGYGWYNTSRIIEVGPGSSVATGRLGAQQAGVHLQVAYQVPLDRFYVSPYLAFDAVYVRTNSYSENGASPFALSERVADNWFVTGSPGVEVGTRFGLSNGSAIRLAAHAGALLVGNSSFERRASFVGAGPGAGTFTRRTSIPSALADVGVGVGLLTSRNLDFDLSYNGDVGSNYAAHSGTLRVAYRF